MEFKVGDKVRYNGDWESLTQYDINGVVEKVITPKIFPMYKIVWYHSSDNSYITRTINPGYDLLHEVQAHRNNFLKDLLL